MTAIYIWDGGKAVAGDTFVTTDTVPMDSNTRAIPYGYPSVDEMLAAAPFHWAHRGGSGDFPEMSLYAYTRSADWGYGGLEVSVNRTSDNVWFGLHDQTLLRTSGVDIDPTTITWAQLQQYRIELPGKPSVPYMPLIEMIVRYGRTHVFIVDPKYRLSEGGVLLDWMTARMPASRIIGKYSGNGTTFANMCRPRGIKSWGYYYAASYDGFRQYFSAWDMLGMEWDAPQAVWNDMLSYNKPVIAHICASRAEADDGIAKGAAGIQTSGVMAVKDRIGGES
jgi:Glycerophosphoryl diester phosphodiesterase family